ncbi:MAG: 3-ketoacyl-ACP reductase [Casimicrobiaceae bacterium]
MLPIPTALVTGGNRGIGRAIVVALARRGFRVAFVDLEETEDTHATRAEALEAGGKTTFIRGNIAELDCHERIVREAWAFGGSVEVLVNNAGISAPVRGDLLEVTQESFDQVMGVNLRGTFFLTQTVARRMLRDSAERPHRSIVTISSISATVASPERAAYCCSKAALSMLVKLFAVRLARHGIACYELRPGIIRTEMTRAIAPHYDQLIGNGIAPIARWGEPDDVGRATAALCAGDFCYMTGEVLHVDGGMHIRRL